MNDRFKFRIPMFSDKGTFIEFQYLELGDEIECSLCGYNGEPQQCSGLKDKKKKLIYEGDIVKMCDKFIDTIEFGCGCFCLSRAFMQYEGTWWSSKNMEVIGNIYENKELLNE